MKLTTRACGFLFGLIAPWIVASSVLATPINGTGTGLTLGAITIGAGNSGNVTGSSGIASGSNNVALASAGAVATASTSFAAGYPASAINNNERSGAPAGSGGYWNDATSGAFPDSVQIAFSGTQTVDRVVVYSVQDNYAAPVEPTDAQTFSLYGIKSFTVQGWDGANWVTLATVTGNNLVKRSVSFTAMATTKIQILVNSSSDNVWSRITEVEAWTQSSGTTDLTLTNSVVGFQNPVGIDFQETTGKLIMSDFYPTGSPHNLDLADPITGTKTQFSNLSILENELKIATVRASACQPTSGFALGEVFTGNGNIGQVIRISPDGSSIQNPWVTLPGETAHVRGSLFQDRFGVAGCNLIVVTGNEQDGTVANDDLGNVWRVTSAGLATKVATVGVHLEGVTTVPDEPAMYGPAAGRILAGAEDYSVPGGPPNYDPQGGVIVAVNPNALNDFFTIGGPGTIGFPGHAHLIATDSFHPEDLDVIRKDAQFFGVAFRDGQVLTAPAVNFDPYCAQVLITQEFPFAGTSGLSALRWNGTQFVVHPLTSNRDGTIQQWEHVTFTSGSDCALIRVEKTPKNGTFNVGQPVTYTIKVTSVGNNVANNVKLVDQLPTNGGLTWASVDNVACVVTPAGLLTCNFGNLAPNQFATVTVTSVPATSTSCMNQPNDGTLGASNRATASADNAPTVTDIGFQTCTVTVAITIKKYTNGADAQTPNDADVPNIAVGGAVTWRYDVKNTGNIGVARAQVVVTDDHTGVTPTPVLVGAFVSGDTNQNNILDPNETWVYQATGTALNLSLTPLDPGKIVAGVCTHNGTEPPRVGYVNQGKVTIPGGSATDPSAYCNPPAPAITIKKYTNGADAQTPNDADVPNIAVGGSVTWRYDVKNTGNVGVPLAQVVVTDDHTGVTPAPVMVGGFVSGDTNQNNVLDVGETWVYQATGIALNLSLTPLDPGKIVAGVCTHNGTESPRTGYVNQGKVTIPGASATDPSAYCNPPAPGITIKKYTNNADANDPNGTDVPNIAVGGTVTWRYEVKNTGNVGVPLAQVVVTDDHTGVTPAPVMVGGFVSGDTNQNNILDLNETWIYQATGIAANLALTPLDPGKIVAGVCTHNSTEPPRVGYVNQGKVTIPGASATDPSSYCNPPAPAITIKKYTNGADAQTPNDADVPNIAIGGAVTWRYDVKNTGNVGVPRAQVVVTDDHTGVTPTAVLIGAFVSGDTNQNDILDVGETWVYQATGIALNLSLTPLDPGKIVAGVCTHSGTESPRTGYVNQGKVTIPGASATDPSAYCNPPAPAVTIKKYTNTADANDPNGADVPNIAVGGAVTWRYDVKNTGNVPVPLAQVVVTDDHAGVTPTPVMVGGFVSGDTNQNNILDLNETWIYQATGIAANLALTPLDPGKIVAGVCTHNSTEPPRTGYVNQGKVTIPGASATDPSSYCNPPGTSVTIKKYTNNADAQTPNDADVPNIVVGGTVTWRYEVKNTGNVPVVLGNVVVTDDHAGVTPVPVFVGGFVSGDTNQNNFLDPNETWIYQATGIAANLSLTPLDPGKILAGVCTHNGTEPPRVGYVNQGKVTIPGGSATDPSAYCNPPAPAITIKKYTNGADAQTPNDTDVPNIAVGGAVTWRYDVKNTGNVPVPLAQVVVTDDHTGVTPTPVMVGGFVSGDANSNNVLDPNETWVYQATGLALNLSLTPLDPGKIVAGVCTHNNTESPRTGYVNQGKVTIPGASATDPSAYCNPPAPGITIKKYTNNADANDPNGTDVPNIVVGGTVTWRYEVKNTGNLPVLLGNVVVTDDHTGVTPVPVFVGGFVSGDTNSNNVLDPGETWIYQATGIAANLSLTPLDPGKIVAGVCTHNSTEPPRVGYVNQGKVTIPGASATDPSSYCNPPAPSVTIKKYTNTADAQTPNDADVPNIAVGGAVTWRYDVKNTGNVPVPLAQVVVTDDHAGVTPTPVMVGGFVSGDSNSNNVLDVTETWIYQATGIALNLSLTPLDPGKIVAGVCTHNNTEPPRTGYVNQGKVTIPGASATDPSAYCNPPAPGVTIKKYTNNADANDPNGTDVPNIVVGGTVTWRYEVKNTGNVPVLLGNVVVTDDHTGVTPIPVFVGGFVSGDTNQNNILDVNETWIYQATGIAANLSLTPLDPGKIVAGVCTHNSTEPPRIGYVNQGKVTIPGSSATDPSSYCNPPAPSVTIKKYTNTADAQTPNDADVPNIAVGGAVTWRYDVKNTGNVPVPLAQVVVTDDHAGVTPTPVMVGGFVSGDTNSNNVLDVNETWIYQATGIALNLSLTPLDPGKIVAGVCTHNNTEPPRTGYVNQGKVTIPGSSATDPSSYCNPPAPSVTIKKYTNTADANDPNGTDVPNIAVGGTVTWRYDVKNTGNVPIAKANVVVTDDHTGVTPAPVLVGAFVSGDTNSNNVLDPGETWIYQATGIAVNLSLTPLDPGKIVAGVCTHNNTEPPRVGYVNQGKVTIPGGSATDPSSYCNPPAPAVTIKKYTNGADAQTPNDTDVPNIAVGGAVTWRYDVKNTGNIPIAKASVVVTDDHTGVTPAPVLVGAFVSGDTNSNNILDVNETWIYQATGIALNLSLTPLDPGKIVAGVCTHNSTQPPRIGYVNQGKVTIPGASATDPSAYCNPPPQLTVVKTPDGGAFAQGAQLTFTIVVSNPAPAGSATAMNVKLADALPVNGGLTWTTATTTQGTCVNPIVGNALDCSLGNIAPQGSVTVTVKTPVTTPTAACTSQPNPAAIATADGGLTAQDSGSLTCTPPGSFTLTKSPKNGSYVIGNNVSFTMVVTSTGPGTANNVVLSDPLPTLGNLNTWTITTNPGGVCTIVANALNCPFGNLANGQVRTVVVSTNVTGGANATACTGVKLNNTATLTGTGLANKTDTGDYTCLPPSITIVKTPDNASINLGDTMKFTLVLTSGGPGVAHNVVLNDPLPTKGGLLSWTFDTGGNPGNACTIVNNVVNCPFGDLASGQVRTVVVKTTTGMPAGACDGTKITNTATVTTNDAGTKSDNGDYTCICAPSEFVFTGNTATSGTAGNIRTFTVNGVSVKASAFARAASGTSGTWSAAYLGMYTSGLGVTDNTEGDGSNNRHVVDNNGLANNYVLFEFSSSVIVDRAFLDYLGADSDITVWVGTKTDPFNNHLTLSDALLTSLPVKEVNDTTVGSGSRWADLNAGAVTGNVLVIAAKEGNTNDSFKISKLQTKCAAGSCLATSYQFTGDTASSGTAGNIRSFALANGVSVNASGFSRVDGTNGAWATAYLGLYGPGMGVTDGSEGDGSNNRHKVDNIGGRNNYVLFEFSQPVIVTRTFLDAIGADSDMSVWVGTKTNPFTSHLTLSDSLLTSLAHTEENLTDVTVTSRWADINTGKVSGNVLVISALATDTSPEDEFKISKLNLQCP